MNPAAATLARSRRGPAMLALLSTSNATASRTRPSAENSTICCGTLLSRIRKSSGFKPVAGRPSRFLTHTSKGTRSTPLLNCGRSAGAFAALPRAREPVDHESTAWACPDAVLSTISASARGARRMLKWRSGVMPVQQVSPIYFPAKSCDQQTLSGILLLCHRAIRRGARRARQGRSQGCSFAPEWPASTAPLRQERPLSPGALTETTRDRLFLCAVDSEMVCRARKPRVGGITRAFRAWRTHERGIRYVLRPHIAKRRCGAAARRLP